MREDPRFSGIHSAFPSPAIDGVKVGAFVLLRKVGAWVQAILGPLQREEGYVSPTHRRLPQYLEAVICGTRVVRGCESKIPYTRGTKSPEIPVWRRFSRSSSTLMFGK